MKKIEISDKLAYVLQRMIVDEIKNQYLWLRQEQEEFGKSHHDKVRIELIEDLKNQRDSLEKQGLPKFEYYY